MSSLDAQRRRGCILLSYGHFIVTRTSKENVESITGAERSRSKGRRKQDRTLNFTSWWLRASAGGAGGLAASACCPLITELSSAAAPPPTSGCRTTTTGNQLLLFGSCWLVGVAASERRPKHPHVALRGPVGNNSHGRQVNNEDLLLVGPCSLHSPSLPLPVATVPLPSVQWNQGMANGSILGRANTWPRSTASWPRSSTARPVGSNSLL